MHEEARRLHVKLPADVLADLDQVGAALATLARLRFVAVFDALQLIRQPLAARMLALTLDWCLRSSSTSIADRSISTASANSIRCSPTSASLAMPKRTCF